MFHLDATTGYMRRKEGAFTAGLALTMIAVILLVSLPLTSINQTASSKSTDSSSTATGIESAVGPNVYFNNSIYRGPTVTFTVAPGAKADMMINVSYPWQNVKPTPPQGFSVEFSLSIGNFPANAKTSTIPSWMHVSVSPESVDIPYESNASVSLLASVDGTAPQGAGGSFQVMIHYVDPASGLSVIDGCDVTINT
jgi:hypothetical protein